VKVVRARVCAERVAQLTRTRETVAVPAESMLAERRRAATAAFWPFLLLFERVRVWFMEVFWFELKYYRIFIFF